MLFFKSWHFKINTSSFVLMDKKRRDLNFSVYELE